MKYSVSPVVQMAVEPQNPSDINLTNEAGQHIIAVGELHLNSS